jgi:hypothetical protein
MSEETLNQKTYLEFVCNGFILLTISCLQPSIMPPDLFLATIFRDPEPRASLIS